jgi:ATP-dependent Clp protease adaptor protein ClpS
MQTEEAMSSTTLHPPIVEKEAAAGERLEDMCQVVLFNDDHNSMEYVIECLIKIFAHPEELAVKIMIEAHVKGKAIAEVESETPARLHKEQLQACGLTAEVERV